MGSVERATQIILRNDSNRYFHLRLLYNFSSSYSGDTQWNLLPPDATAKPLSVDFGTRGVRIVKANFNVYGILYKEVKEKGPNTITTNGVFLEMEELFLLPKLEGVPLNVGKADENQTIDVNVGNDEVLIEGNTDKVSVQFVRIGNYF